MMPGRPSVDVLVTKYQRCVKKGLKDFGLFKINSITAYSLVSLLTKNVVKNSCLSLPEMFT